MEVFSDPKLELSTMLIGTCDLAAQLLAEKGARLGAPLPGPNSGIVILSKDGVVKSKLLIPDPGNISLTVKDIERMAGLTGAD